MSHSICRLRGLTCALLLGVLATANGRAETPADSVYAAPAAASSSGFDPALDARIQQLKQQSLQLDAETLRLERRLAHPRDQRVAVDVGVTVPGLLIDHLEVSLDDATPVEQSFDAATAIALLHGGLRRIATVNLAAGAHRIRARFSAHYADAAPGAAPITGSVESLFRKDRRSLTLELAIVVAGPLDRPRLRVTAWRPGA